MQWYQRPQDAGQMVSIEWAATPDGALLHWSTNEKLATEAAREEA